MKKLFKKILGILVISLNISAAQSNNGMAFLKVDVDARAAALAGAFTAMVHDAAATYWNPAGLVHTENQSVIVMHNDWLWDFEQSYAAYQFLSGNHNLAFSVNYFQTPGIETRIGATEEPAGVVDAYSLAIGLSYAKKYTENWSAGVTLKYMFEKYYLVSAPGWAVDFGLQGVDFLEWGDFGIAIRNLGRMSKLDKSASSLPVIITTDFSIIVPKFFDQKLIVMPGLRWIEKEKTYAQLGTEYRLYDNLYLRAGLRSAQEGILWSGGLGINYKSFNIDYAYAPFEYSLGSSNRFSLGFIF